MSELDQLRIPFEKIEFDKEIESHGYGSMFHGKAAGRRAALKRINITSLGDIKPQLLAEVLTVSRFRRHPNLVALLGFCDEKSNEVVLVYEHVDGGSLADRMPKHPTTIQRLEICLGAARGLAYLHHGVSPDTPGLIHGDVKPSKILLNLNLNPGSSSAKFEAKVSNFGLSKVRPGHVREIAGPTPAYRDPQYEFTGQVTMASDVYSLGVVLLEVLCGVSELVDTDDYQERHVTELVPKRLEQNRLRKVVHFDIRNEIKAECLETYAKIACRCVATPPEDRPTMAQVVVELEDALRLQGGEVPPLPDLNDRSGSVENDRKNVNYNIDEKNSVKNDRGVDGDVSIERNIDNNKLDFVGETRGNRVENNVFSNDSTEDEKTNDDIILGGKVSLLSDLDDRSNEKNSVENDQDIDDDVAINGSNVHGKYHEADDFSIEQNVDNKKSDFIKETKGDKVESKFFSDDSTEDKKTDDITLMIEKDNTNVVSTSVNDTESRQRFVEGHDRSDKTDVGSVPKENPDVVEASTNGPESGEESTDTDDAFDSTHVEDAQNHTENVVVTGTDGLEGGEVAADALNSTVEPDLIDTNGWSPSPEPHDDLLQTAYKDSTKVTQDSDKKPETFTTIREESRGDSVSNNTLKPFAKTEESDTDRSLEVTVGTRERHFEGLGSHDEVKPIIEKTRDNKVERSHSTSSESGDGDNSMPSDSLLQHKSSSGQDKVTKKTTNGSRDCCSVCASWRRLFSNRIALCGGLFWNKLVHFVTWINRQITHKNAIKGNSFLGL